MDVKRYDRSGKYAANHDYELYSREEFLNVIIEGYEAITAAVKMGIHNECSSTGWSLNYLETGLKLLGYTEAASLVKTNFVQSALVFTECLRKQAIQVVR